MRLRTITVVSCGVLLLVTGATSVVSTTVPVVEDLGTRNKGSDWPSFLGPLGDGKSPETSLDLDWPAEGPRVVWTHEVGEGYSMPSISRGRLFLFDRHGDRARLTCLESETGKEIWRKEYPTSYEDMYGFSTGAKAAPLVDDERVYIHGVEGRLRCHRVNDGKLLWEVDTQKRFGFVQNFFGVGSSPVIEGPLLIVPVGGSPPDSPSIQSGEVKGAGSGIVAFDKLTGRVRYAITDELASYSSPVLETVGDRRWGFYFARGGLVGFEPTKGEVDFFFPWRAKKPESVNAANPVIVGDTVFITESYGPGGALLRFKPGGYEVIRKDPDRRGAMRSHWPTPIHHDGTLYGSSGSGSADAALRAVDYRTGKVAWSHPGLGRSTLLYADGHFLVLTERGKLLVIRASPEKFDPVSEVDLGASGTDPASSGPLLTYPSWNAPILSHGLLYVRGKDRLACLDLTPPSKPAPPTGSSGSSAPGRGE